MACECYKIGGPWVSFDPDCPAHGNEAQRREQRQEEDAAEHEARWDQLYKTLDEIRERLTALEATATKHRRTHTRFK